jgi:hypothetical protein
MTAVDWLFKQLWDEPKDKLTWYALRKKAMQLEKQQIEEAYKSGIIDKSTFNSDKSKTYYNETYDNPGAILRKEIPY